MTPEITDRDGDEGIDAGGEVEGQTPQKYKDEGDQEPSLSEKVADHTSFKTASPRRRGVTETQSRENLAVDTVYGLIITHHLKRDIELDLCRNQTDLIITGLVCQGYPNSLRPRGDLFIQNCRKTQKNLPLIQGHLLRGEGERFHKWLGIKNLTERDPLQGFKGKFCWDIKVI